MRIAALLATALDENNRWLRMRLVRSNALTAVFADYWAFY
jgi:hypothetical protein